MISDGVLVACKLLMHGRTHCGNRVLRRAAPDIALRRRYGAAGLQILRGNPHRGCGLGMEKVREKGAR